MPPRTPRQTKVEGRHSLRQFVATALDVLSGDPHVDEVVHLANDVVELEFDGKTPPASIHPLPPEFEYHFSGWCGMYVGVRRKGDWADY
jgi:hypothetical protein